MNLIEKIVGCLPEDMPSMLLDRTDNEIAVHHILRAITEAGYAVVPVKTIREAHAVMRECGWQLAPASVTSGDGVLEAACAEIEDKFRAMSARAAEKAVPSPSPRAQDGTK